MSVFKRLKVLFVAVLVSAAAVISLQPRIASADEAAPAVTAPAAASVKGTEVVDNPYGLDALWKGGDFVSKGTLVILVIMSMGTWYVMVVKLFEQHKLFRQYNDVKKTFWTAGNLNDGIQSLSDKNAFRFIAEKTVSAGDHHSGTMTDQIDFNTWVTMQVQRAVENVQNRLQDGLAFLATVGSTAPFVGLFGTVWGIYHALTAIGIAGQASIDKVAGPVGEALIMTAIGLAVAVPAVLGYNWLVRRNKSCMENVRFFAGEVHMVVMSKSQRKA
jgi:biopolymer transport protein ExbB